MAHTEPTPHLCGDTVRAGVVRAAAQRPTTALTVLFADVVGSTRLYESFGDDQAKQMIDDCLAALGGVVQQYGGRIIKTIGDEIMCVLPSADSGCLANA